MLSEKLLGPQKKGQLRATGNDVIEIDILPPSLSNCESLFVSYNCISEIENIIQFRNLQILLIEYNQIEFIEKLMPLKELPKLREIRIEGNPVALLPLYDIHLYKICTTLEKIDGSSLLNRYKNKHKIEDLLSRTTKEEYYLNSIYIIKSFLSYANDPNENKLEDKIHVFHSYRRKGKYTKPISYLKILKEEMDMLLEALHSQYPDIKLDFPEECNESNLKPLLEYKELQCDPFAFDADMLYPQKVVEPEPEPAPPPKLSVQPPQPVRQTKTSRTRELTTAHHDVYDRSSTASARAALSSELVNFSEFGAQKTADEGVQNSADAVGKEVAFDVNENDNGRNKNEDEDGLIEGLDESESGMMDDLNISSESAPNDSKDGEEQQVSVGDDEKQKSSQSDNKETSQLEIDDLESDIDKESESNIDDLNLSGKENSLLESADNELDSDNNNVNENQIQNVEVISEYESGELRLSMLEEDASDEEESLGNDKKDISLDGSDLEARKKSLLNPGESLLDEGDVAPIEGLSSSSSPSEDAKPKRRPLTMDDMMRLESDSETIGDEIEELVRKARGSPLMSLTVPLPPEIPLRETNSPIKKTPPRGRSLIFAAQPAHDVSLSPTSSQRPLTFTPLKTIDVSPPKRSSPRSFILLSELVGIEPQQNESPGKQEEPRSPQRLKVDNLIDALTSSSSSTSMSDEASELEGLSEQEIADSVENFMLSSSSSGDELYDYKAEEANSSRHLLMSDEGLVDDLRPSGADASEEGELRSDSGRPLASSSELEEGEIESDNGRLDSFAEAERMACRSSTVGGSHPGDLPLPPADEGVESEKELREYEDSSDVIHSESEPEAKSGDGNERNEENLSSDPNYEKLKESDDRIDSDSIELKPHEEIGDSDDRIDKSSSSKDDLEDGKMDISDAELEEEELEENQIEDDAKEEHQSTIKSSDGDLEEEDIDNVEKENIFKEEKQSSNSEIDSENKEEDGVLLDVEEKEAQDEPQEVTELDGLDNTGESGSSDEEEAGEFLAFRKDGIPSITEPSSMQSNEDDESSENGSEADDLRCILQLSSQILDVADRWGINGVAPRRSPEYLFRAFAKWKTSMRKRNSDRAKASESLTPQKPTRVRYDSSNLTGGEELMSPGPLLRQKCNLIKTIRAQRQINEALKYEREQLEREAKRLSKNCM